MADTQQNATESAAPDSYAGGSTQTSTGNADAVLNVSGLDQSDSQAEVRSPWREVRLFLPPDTAGPSTASRIASSDSDPKPTAAELKAAFGGALSGRNGPDAPLMTKAMREKEDARLGRVKKQYTDVRIRIRFPSRHQLEAVFPIEATINAAYDFVRSHLNAQGQKASFILYQTPPKRDLGEKDVKLKGKTFGEMGFAPQAVLMLRWEKADWNTSTSQAYLSNALLQQASPLPAPPSFEQQVNSPHAAQTSQKPTEEKATGEKKMPKWLKGLQKK
ncbi:hypothetical protein IE81DRAFT_321406 [Ceraceosorus guamensis]|uniref:UBX domain-containing protein n=1 Tax=Ceraceosorus guamensis TaxID=1522189 RepID=A0A316W692_9BASI|nr:hypothetical protein IE81DRAFT_321406 [Ceraceosorus guamensis]PWN44261.1 hypothetical protein IE81DRAFT_321406 [Ceraceosorus guamensis]